MYLRRSTSEIEEESMISKENKQKVENDVFGVEILEGGKRRFKMYDKISLSGTTPFEVASMDK